MWQKCCQSRETCFVILLQDPVSKNKLLGQITDCLPVEFVLHINHLDDDSFLYTIFGNMQSLEEYAPNQLHSFYTISAELISETITLISYIDPLLNS